MTPEYIMRKVADWHGITWEEMLSTHTRYEIVAARHEAWFLAIEITQVPVIHVARIGGWCWKNISNHTANYKGPDRSHYIIDGRTPPPLPRKPGRPPNPTEYERRMAYLRKNPKLLEAHLEKERARKRRRNALKAQASEARAHV